MSSQAKEHILIVLSDNQISFLLDRVLKSLGYMVTLSADPMAAMREMTLRGPSVVILGDRVGSSSGLDLAAEILKRYPSVPVLLFVTQDSPELLRSALRLGVSDYLCLPLKSDEISRAVQNAIQRADQRREWVLLEARRHTASLQHRIDELETLARLGRSMTGSLDLDSVLSAVVEAAVQITGAEEGSLLLLDEKTGELYMRAARNFQEEFVRTFRLPIQDTLAGNVLRSGQAVLIDDQTPHKIVSSYLVRSLIYVPLQINGHVFGVLGVDNRQNLAPLQNRDVKVLSALAEFAVIAIENARLYNHMIQERNKIETILTGIDNGVLVVDNDRRVLMVNQIAADALGLRSRTLIGAPYRDVVHQPEILDMLDAVEPAQTRAELTVEDGRIFSAYSTPIKDVGIAITLHDITNLKKLDHIKSDFVATVSHDLRSPLTAILGYTELIERSGPVNDMQRDFIKRVQTSVHNISSLVDNLLNLGRIEAGFDSRRESISLNKMFAFAAENYRKVIVERDLRVKINFPEDFPEVSANPIQMRQVVENLLDNAVKYTPDGGEVNVMGEVAQDQVILQVRDTGIGIPPMDLPYIFDKFYRASNADDSQSGTGLGLSIVKSIVEAHRGRIWVDSEIGTGTTFTVVLPLDNS